jgi:hypothetical protein
MATKRQIGANGTAWQLGDNEETLVEWEVALPLGRTPITIVCYGPKAIYYHTEGNPPCAGDNDNGTVQPGGSSHFTATAAVVFVPRIYLHAKYGATAAAIFAGPMRLYGTVGTDAANGIDAVLKKIHEVFPGVA